MLNAFTSRINTWYNTYGKILIIKQYCGKYLSESFCPRSA